jgi:hypothetical protein
MHEILLFFFKNYPNLKQQQQLLLCVVAVAVDELKYRENIFFISLFYIYTDIFRFFNYINNNHLQRKTSLFCRSFR